MHTSYIQQYTYIKEVGIYVIGANNTRDFMQLHTRFVIW